MSVKTIYSQLLVLDFTVSNNSESRLEKRMRGLSPDVGALRSYNDLHTSQSLPHTAWAVNPQSQHKLPGMKCVNINKQKRYREKFHCRHNWSTRITSLPTIHRPTHSPAPITDSRTKRSKLLRRSYYIVIIKAHNLITIKVKSNMGSCCPSH
jgi:hypothetical protein